MKLRKEIGLWALSTALFATPVGAQTCKETIPASTPDSRFTQHGDGTVTDTHTALMWKQCSEGQSGGDCTGSAATYTWQQALQRAKTVNDGGGFAGYSDWRLPNVKELRSIVEESCYSPAVNLTVFPATHSSPYWSASTYAHYSDDAWDVFFYHGRVTVDDKSNAGYVRLVRGGQ